ELLRCQERATGVDCGSLEETAEHWERVRTYYAPFETGQLAPSAEVYRHEMPGGQSTNLLKQAEAVGLGDRWHEVCRVYAEVNQLFGDIIKVRPTSKGVGDMGLFLGGNKRTPAGVVGGAR